MKRALLPILLAFNILVSPVQAEDAKKLTFGEALQMTLHNNGSMRQSAHERQQLEQEMKAAAGLKYPRVSLNANYSLLKDPVHMDLTPVKDAITPLYGALGKYGVFSGVANPDPATSALVPVLPENLSTQVVRQKLLEGLEAIEAAGWDMTIQEKQFATVTAGFVWPVFTGGKISAANDAARIRYETAGIGETRKSFELTGELVERYFGKVLSDKALQVRKQVRVTMEQHYREAEKLHSQGMIAQVELLNARLNLAEADRELQKAERQCALVSEALSNTLSAGEQVSFEPADNLFYLDSLEQADYFYQAALARSPYLMEVGKKKELAGAGYKAESAGLLPSVALTGLYDVANKNLSPYLPGYMVGVGLKWNIFSGFSQERKLKAIRFQQLQADDVYGKVSADIHTAVSKNYQELNMYREQLRMLKSAMAMALEYLDVREKAFREGMATSAQVADASLLLAKTRTERLQAMYNYDVSLGRLLFYAGLSDHFEEYMHRAATGNSRPDAE